MEIQKERINLFKFVKNQYDFFKISKTIRRIKILESFLLTKMKPEWIFFTKLIVSPAGIRQIDSNNSDELLLNSDINQLYQKIIRLNNKIGSLSLSDSDFFYSISLSRNLQENLDFLIEDSKTENIINMNNRPIASLSSLLEGKFGKFRQEILGKRVNYSGRTVKSVNPQLRLNQCGIPFLMAKTIYDSFIKKILRFIILYYKKQLIKKKNKITKDTKQINLLKKLIKENDITKLNGLKEIIILENKIFKNNFVLIFEILKLIIKNKIVFLNRAPTLHKLGIEAFEPILVASKTIQIHPLVCSSYNADFDGDQMSLHIPLTNLSNLEIRNLVLASKTILSPANNNIQIKPSQDIIIGLYYLTLKNEIFNCSTKGLYFNNFDEIINIFFNKKINIHTPIWLKFKIPITIKNNNLNTFNNNKKNILFLRTTIGRVIFNKVIQNNLFS
jgi:DNA-directed RNA polymerase subunit beta'